MSPFDREIAARTGYAEASSEGRDGLRAVIHVINNRAKQRGWSLAEVCMHGPAFSCWNALLTIRDKVVANPDRIRVVKAADNDPVLVMAREIVDKVVDGGDNDLTSGATHYYVLNTPAPDWAASMQCCGIIGKHVFYKERSVSA